MSAQIFVVIGHMLGAGRFSWAEGVVRVHHGSGTDLEDTYTERFWCRNHRWRVDRSDGISESVHVGVESRVRVNGTFERGPGNGVGHLAAGKLLQPTNALIWGRPGEDWRPTGELDPVGDNKWRLWLERIDGGYPEHTGYADVEEISGIIHELHTGFTTLTLESLATEDTARRGETWLTLQP
ncbi:hypothetical protein [Nocardioides sp.]|uniref:hypothetical protein n=1 Tax=Nocardioides sp. TaxID=35761 RepID=UPI0037838465